MQKIVLASSNKGKIREISEILSNCDINLIPQSELNIQDADEIGTTFIENAIIKAKHAAIISKLPAIADDSGICVEVLDNKPGVRSARFSGDNASALSNNEKLITTLKNSDKAPPFKAFYYCVTVFMTSHDTPTPIICEGKIEGEITLTPRGDKGFGYDPVFYIPKLKKTAAEIEPFDKNRISHRGESLRKLKVALEAIYK